MPNSVNRGWKYLEARFGISKQDLNYDLEKISGDLWITSEEMRNKFDAETTGIRFIRIMDIGLKPTTYGLQLLDDLIEKNIVEVSENELEKLLDGEMIRRGLSEKGYVAIRFEDKVIGCGFYKDQKVSSRIPKGRGKELLQIIKFQN